jgi:DNA-binding NtrC family response regulator
MASGKRLLVVEDDNDFRQIMVETLFDAGFEVVEAEDGDHAIAILERLDPIDVVVTDIEMPGHCNGNDVATEAKSRHPEVTVVYMSGHPESLTNRIGPRDVFLGKPFQSARIIFEIRRLLNAAETVA